ncbi:glycosyltransferase WbsX family protein [Capnocytophaga gingivalis]|uniref:glycosyltransferase WbsX family protein n=1 Tax=Capnocytophaga gingivalis TaxID=1017 RepID=UPI0028E8DC01|nr:glycoside hydrolase family 99-like domain-containing protein [Capnocytophaga gingivalis]
MKYIAFYFPQFHPIKENNRWWGDGFTDWDLVKKAKKYDSEQNQPRIPFDSNYYDLSNSESITWQVELAKKFGLGGFNFYHYWFDGKLILEKPMELFLENKNNELDFCITWANETWTKQWIGSSEVLIEQRHCNNKEIWNNHFNYLLKFFKDRRYIKIDNKPIFCIYRPELNKEMDEYIDFFNKKAIENGFKGIYFIGMKSYDIDKESIVYRNFNAKMFFQPRYLFNKKFFQRKSLTSKIEKKLRLLPEKIQLFIGRMKFLFEKNKKIDYTAFGEELLNLASNTKEKIYQSIIVDWDNTARYKKRSKFFINASPFNFEKYLSRLTKIEKEKNNEFIFINAWNEWSEGAYLEPDTKNKCEYLEVIKKLSK